MSIKKYIVLLFPFFVPMTLWAQLTIRGNVIDEDNQPIVGAIVSLNTINRTDTILIEGVNTDENGNYVITNIHLGEYLIRYTMLGLTEHLQQIRLYSDMIMDTVQMVYNSNLLEEVTVEGGLLSTYGTKETRLFTNIERDKAISGLELMKVLPQISLNNLANKLTTNAGKPILILKDGVIIGEADLMGMPPSEILKAEYYSQPPAKYMNMGVDAVLVITTRRTEETGGYAIANLKNSFTTGFGTDILQGKHSFGDNDVSFSYFIDYRNLNKNQTDQAYGGLLDNTLCEVNKKGLNSDYRGEYHILQSTYSHVKENDLYFNAKAKMIVSPGMEDSRQDVLASYANQPLLHSASDLYIKTETYSPSLDLYFSKKLKKDQELSFNVVNTWYDVSSDRKLSQIPTNENNQGYETISYTKNKSYSLIGEATYSKNFKNQSLTIGARHLYKTATDNFYLDQSIPNTTTDNINDLYYYIGLSGKLKSINYSLDLGGEHIWLKTDLGKTFFTPKPSLFVSYDKKDSQFAIKSTIQTQSPDMSVLSDNPITIDPLLISYGNSRLKPYSTFINTLFYTLNQPKFYLKTSIASSVIHNPYRLAFINQRDTFEKVYMQPDNDEHALEYDIEFTWKPVDWFSIKPYYAIVYQWHDMDRKKYENVFSYASLYTSFSYKKFTLNGQVIVQNKSLEGTLLNQQSNYYSVDLTWKKERLSCTLACLFLNSPSRLETYKGAAVSYRESKRWENFKGLMYVQLIYTLPWGKNIQRKIQKTLNNSDTDSGLSIDNKAKL